MLYTQKSGVVSTTEIGVIMLSAGVLCFHGLDFNLDILMTRKMLGFMTNECLTAVGFVIGSLAQAWSENQFTGKYITGILHFWSQEPPIAFIYRINCLR